MYQTHRQIFSKLSFKGFLFSSIIVLIAGCTVQPVAENKKILAKTNFQKVFSYNYESVWRAAQLTLKYPIAVNNMENGLLETEWIRGDEAYFAPNQKAPSSGVRNKLTLTLVKGRTDNKSTVRISITKKIERQKDFFADVESLITDGIEEKVILYRIERELIIEEALKKASAQGN